LHPVIKVLEISRFPDTANILRAKAGHRPHGKCLDQGKTAPNWILNLRHGQVILPPNAGHSTIVFEKPEVRPNFAGKYAPAC
jgi:hypothetical protein